MSIAEFSATLRDAAYKSWFKNSGKNILVQTTSSLRKEAQSSERTSFFLSTDSLLQIAEKLSGRSLTEDEAEILYSDLLGLVDNKKAILIQEELKDKTVTGVYFRQIAFERGIENVLDKTLSSIKERVIVEDNGIERPARVSDFFQRGHVFGIAANVATQTARNLNRSLVTKEVKDKLLNVLVTVRNRLIRDDIATSNIKDLRFSLYAKYLKTPYRYLVEMQLTGINQQAGTDTAVFTNALRRYFEPKNDTSIPRFFRDNKSEGDKLVQKLITNKGSPSFIDLIGMNIADTLSGKNRKKKFETSNAKAADLTYKLDTSRLQVKNKKNISEINKAISKVQSIAIPVQPTIEKSSINLLALIQARLALQIKKNMGTGSATKVLNYRSGRLAESAQLERLTTSREGTISIFYNYMKNPYATFSEGGRQQSPVSRDPKTLISKSIREIGATLTSSRMRAVLI